MSDKDENKALADTAMFGAEAEKVLNNDAYVFATTSIKGRIIAELATIPILGDNNKSLELVRSLQSITKIQDELEEIMQEGKVAERSLLDRIKNPNRYKRV